MTLVSLPAIAIFRLCKRPGIATFGLSFYLYALILVVVSVLLDNKFTSIQLVVIVVLYSRNRDVIRRVWYWRYASPYGEIGKSRNPYLYIRNRISISVCLSVCLSFCPTGRYLLLNGKSFWLPFFFQKFIWWWEWTISFTWSSSKIAYHFVTWVVLDGNA